MKKLRLNAANSKNLILVKLLNNSEMEKYSKELEIDVNEMRYPDHDCGRILHIINDGPIDLFIGEIIIFKAGYLTYHYNDIGLVCIEVIESRYKTKKVLDALLAKATPIKPR